MGRRRVRERGERPAEDTPPAPGAPSLPTPIDWWKLHSQERSETLTVLSEWVRRLVCSYALADQVVPPCWYQHESVVQELLALFQYRNQQQFTDVAPPSAPLDFHQQFSVAVVRLRGWVSAAGCTSAEHFDETPALWAVPGVSTAKWTVQFEEHLQGAYRLGEELGTIERSQE